MSHKKSGLNPAPTEPAQEETAKDNLNTKHLKCQSQKQKVISFPSGNQLPKEPPADLGNCAGIGNQDYITAIKSLTATELKETFPRTYKSWDNMKQRKKEGKIIHKEFDKFKDFLRHVGPCENKKYTLDRIDNSDPEYAPGKVEWRDKYAQNSNKSNNIYLTHDDGRKLTVAQWACITGTKSSTLYRRRTDGWSDMEIITGKRNKQPTNPFPYKNRKEWELHYLKKVGLGYKKDRLSFLNEESLRIIEPLKNKAIELSYDIAKLEIAEPDDKNLTYLREELHKVNSNYEAFIQAYTETSQQLEYNEKMEIYLRKFSDNSKLMRIELANYEHIYPRPKYTINQPDSAIQQPT